MAWTNLLALEGIEPSYVYDDAGGPITPLVEIDGTTFTVSRAGGDTGWYALTIQFDADGKISTPCNVRVTVSGAFTATNTYFAIFNPDTGDTVPADPNTTASPFSDLVLETTYSGGEGEITFSGYDSGTVVDELTITIELDGTPIVGRKGLVKNFRRVVIPFQQGQPFIPPSHTCTEIPPPDGGGDDPPGGGGPGDGGGGGGSQPPDDDLPLCIFEWRQNRDANGNELPGGAWIPINAPCRLH